MKQKRFRKWVGLIGLICLVLFTFAPTALAFEFREGDTVVIGAGEVVEDDLYVGANTFTLDGTVKGDLIVFGSTIEINGTVEGDLIAAGQSVWTARPRWAMTWWPLVSASRTRKVALWAAISSTAATRPSWLAMWPRT
jgi:hypothetical protein